jgi:Na+-translocating ferredoxin:NAD+ oxidoreductase RnfG subunit
MPLDIRWLAPAAIIATVSPPCIAARYMSLEQAQALIFAQADQFVPANVTLTPEQIDRIERQAGVKIRVPEQHVWQARAAGKLLGWFIVDQVIGKHELITYALGVNLDGSVKQFQVIEYREAYGYQVRELKWRDQFVGKTLADPLKVGVDIANISGGTLSSQHMTEGIRRLLAFQQVVLRP